MNTQALIWMVSAYSIVTYMTIHYFVKVLRTPPKDPQNDSYLDT